MTKFVALLLALAPLVAAQRGGPGERHDQGFGRDFGHGATNPEHCCECVPYFECTNGIINRPHNDPNHHDSHGVQNDTLQCANDLVEFCCPVPNAPESCKEHFKTPMPKVNTQPQPNKLCKCSHWELCSPQAVVTDGKGKRSEMGLTTHSKCADPNMVCCDETSENPKISTRLNGGPAPAGECFCVPQINCIGGVLNTDGEGIIQPRIGNNACPKDQVCCHKKSESGSGAESNMAPSIFLGLISASYFFI